MAAATRRTRRQRGLGPALLLAWALADASPGRAEALDASVRDPGGEPVKDAVVYALPLAPDAGAAPPPQRVEIDQVDKEYVPYVTAVRAGTPVDFPNHDQIRHHVYSFSAAKTFEIPLYEGRPAEPVIFDKPGEVALGCNIHDWMRAYVFVTPTPYFAVTDGAGAAKLELPPGAYRVEVWHPALRGDPAATGREVELAAGERAELHFSIQQRRVWRPRRSPSTGDPGYR
jgi:plastocyanin